MLAKELPFPDRFDAARAFVARRYGDLEACTEIETGARLALFALGQQVAVGPCNTPQPYAWHLTERYKHTAWSSLGRMSPFEAMVKYVQVLETVSAEWATEEAPVQAELPTGAPSPAPHDAAQAVEVPAAASSSALVPLDDLPTAVTAETVRLLTDEVRRLRAALKVATGRGSSTEFVPTPVRSAGPGPLPVPPPAVPAGRRVVVSPPDHSSISTGPRTEPAPAATGPSASQLQRPLGWMEWMGLA